MAKYKFILECENGSFEARIEGTNKEFRDAFHSVILKEKRFFGIFYSALELAKTAPPNDVLKMIENTVVFSMQKEIEGGLHGVTFMSQGSNADLIVCLGVTFARSKGVFQIVEEVVKFHAPNNPEFQNIEGFAEYLKRVSDCENKKPDSKEEPGY